MSHYTPPPTPEPQQPTKQPPSAAAKGCGCLGLLAIIIVAIASWSSSGSGTNTTSSSDQATSTPAPATTTAAPAPKVTSNGPAVAKWASDGGSVVISTIQADLSDITTASSNDDTAGLATACSSLATDVHDAQVYEPIPDPTTQADWSAGLADYKASAADCKAGTAALSATLITKSGAELQAGTDKMTAAAARIKSLSSSGA